MIRQVSSTLSCRLKRLLSPIIAACSSTSYGVAPSPPCSANSRSRLTCSGCSDIGALGLDQHPDPGGGVEPHDELVGLRAPRALGKEAEPRRMLEHEPQLGHGFRQVLARADEERHPGPAPVVDLAAAEPRRSPSSSRKPRPRPRGSRRAGRARSARGRRRAWPGRPRPSRSPACLGRRPPAAPSPWWPPPASGGSPPRRGAPRRDRRNGRDRPPRRSRPS